MNDDEEIPEQRILHANSVTQNKKNKSDISCLTYKPLNIGQKGKSGVDRENRFQQGGGNAGGEPRKRRESSKSQLRKLKRQEGANVGGQDADDRGSGGF